MRRSALAAVVLLLVSGPARRGGIGKNADSVAHRHDHKPIEVDPKVIARYVGVYQASPTQIVIIGMDGNQLTAKVGPPPQVALAESDTKFFVAGLEIEFPKVAEGAHADQ